jgi:hypothetical protein
MRKKNNPTHRLLIRVEDKSKPRIVRNGVEYTPVKWMELTELNLGSLAKPKKICKDIMVIRLEPVKYN